MIANSMEIPTTPPEPLTIVTALSSLKAIRTIFKDQLQNDREFYRIIVSQPFLMTDNVSFKQDAYKQMTANKIAAIKDLKAIRDIAAGNMQTYQRIKLKIFSGTIEPLYWINSYGALPGDVPGAREAILDPGNQQCQSYQSLYPFFQFCCVVHQIANGFLDEPAEPNQPAPQVIKEPPPKRQKTQDQVALEHFYNKSPITRDNGNEIALKNGFTAPKSGEGLYHKYSYYSKRDHRIGEMESPTKLKIRNKIKLFESVLPFLIDSGKSQLNDEIKPLKIKLKTDY